MGLPERLAKAREASALPRRVLDTQAGLSNGVTQRIEDAVTLPGLDTAELLARALGIDPGWLAYGALGARPFGSGRFPVSAQGTDEPQRLQAPPATPLSCLGAGERLAMARGALGLSRSALARLTALSHTAIGNLEAGRSLPSVATAEQLAAALGVSPCWLAYGVGAQPSFATDDG